MTTTLARMEERREEAGHGDDASPVPFALLATAYRRAAGGLARAGADVCEGLCGVLTGQQLHTA